MDQIFIVGVAMTPFGKQLDRSVKQLASQAVGDACSDTGCEVDAIEAAFYGNCVQGHMEGQDMIRGEIALRAMGIEGIPVINVENACATASTALHMAVAYARAGEAGVVLAVGAEKMFSPDKAKMFGAFDGAWDVHGVDASRETLLTMGEGVEVPDGTMSDKPYSVFMDFYAAMSRMHMKKYGSTREQLAAVAAKNHMHSTKNPLAQYQMPYTVEEVLAAPPIAYPLTLPMCSPISDGAAAAIICNAEGLKRIGADANRAVRVLASAVQTGSDRAADDLDRHISRRAADQAYQRAGIAPDDIDVAEVHDATAAGEVIEVEALRLVTPGDGAAAAERGETSIGGRIPVNPSGGLECKGHPIGATGLAQVYELVTQLRGEAGDRQVENAQHAIAQNGGGLVGVEEAVTAVTLLGRA